MTQKIKRLMDILMALVLIIILALFWIIISIIIKLTSKGPVVFAQERPGRYREIIKVYKFRTMYLGSEQMIKGKEVTKEDDRITPIGHFLRRFKVDETLQALNVLKGNMSFIGPRPERIASLDDYTDEISKRLNMLPGLTGLAQVSGNIYLSLEERYALDIYYVENYSLWMDIRIIFRTVGVILFGGREVCGQAVGKFRRYGGNKMKKMLITGVDSYVGMSLESYMVQFEKCVENITFLYDAKCFLGTIFKVLKKADVKEGRMEKSETKMGVR